LIWATKNLTTESKTLTFLIVASQNLVKSKRRKKKVARQRLITASLSSRYKSSKMRLIDSRTSLSRPDSNLMNKVSSWPTSKKHSPLLRSELKMPSLTVKSSKTRIVSISIKCRIKKMSSKIRHLLLPN